VSYAGFATNMANGSENPVRNHYFHAPEHVEVHKADLTDQAKNPQAPREGIGEKGIPMQGVIFESRHVRLLLEAIGDQNHPLREHAVQAVGGFAGVAEQSGVDTRAMEARESKVPPEYQVVTSLNQAAALIGVPPEEIVTMPDIRREWDVKRSRVQDWIRQGPQGQPHLTPLDVRLKGYHGSQQLLFRRGDVQRLAENPPKPGRPRK
jgi:hypothetical protein